MNECPISITTALRNCTSKSKLTGNLVDLMSHLSALISETPKQCTRDSALILSSPTHCWEYGSLVTGHCHSWPCSTQHEYQCEKTSLRAEHIYKLNYPYTNTRLSMDLMEFDSTMGVFFYLLALRRGSLLLSCRTNRGEDFSQKMLWWLCCSTDFTCKASWQMCLCSDVLNLLTIVGAWVDTLKVYQRNQTHYNI